MHAKVWGHNVSNRPIKSSRAKRWDDTTKPIVSDLVAKIESDLRTHADPAISWRQMGGAALTHVGRRPESLKKLNDANEPATQTPSASQLQSSATQPNALLSLWSPATVKAMQSARPSPVTKRTSGPSPMLPPQAVGSSRSLPKPLDSASPRKHQPPSPPRAQTSTAPLLGSPRANGSTRNLNAQHTAPNRIATPTSRASRTSPPIHPPQAHRSPHTSSPPQSQLAPSPPRGQTATSFTPGHRQSSPLAEGASTRPPKTSGVPSRTNGPPTDSAPAPSSRRPKSPPSVRHVNTAYPPSSSLGPKASNHIRPMLPHCTAPGTPRTLHRSTSRVQFESPPATAAAPPVPERPPSRSPKPILKKARGLPTPQASPEKDAATVPTTPSLVARKDVPREAIRPEGRSEVVIKMQSPTNSEGSVKETKEAGAPMAKFYTTERDATGSGFTRRRSPPLPSGLGDARKLPAVDRSPSSDKERGASHSPAKAAGPLPGSVPAQANPVRTVTPKTEGQVYNSSSSRRPAVTLEKQSQRESQPALGMSNPVKEGTPSNASPLGGMSSVNNFNKAQPMGASSTTLASTAPGPSTMEMPAADEHSDRGDDRQKRCPPTNMTTTQPGRAPVPKATPRQTSTPEDVEDDDGDASVFSSSTGSELTEVLDLPACLANRFDIRSACKSLYRAQCLFAEQAYPSRALFAHILTAVEPYHPLSLARWDTLPHALDTRLLPALLRTLAAHPNKRAQRSFFPCALLRVLSAYSETTALDVLTHVDAHMPRSKLCVGRREEYAPPAARVVGRLWGAIDAAVKGPLKRIALRHCRREECKEWALRANRWGLREWLLFLLPEGPTARAAARAQMLSGMCATCRHSGKEEWVVGREVVWQAFALDKARPEKDTGDGASDTTCERGEDRGVMSAREMRRLRRCEYMHTRYMWKKPSPADEQDALEEVLDPGRMWTALVSDEGTPLYRRNPLVLDTVSLIDD